MKTRKLLASALALVMLFAMAIPTFAYDTTLELGGTTTVPIISLAMPDDAEKVTLNPYGLTITFAKTSQPGTATDQIASPTLFVKNLSNCQLKVVIKASATVAGEAKLATASTASDAAGSAKNVFLTLTAQTVSDTSTALAPETTARDASATQSGCIVLEKTAREIGKMDAATAATAKINVLDKAATVEKTPSSTYGILALRLGGDMSKTPKTDWTEADTVTTNIAFNFTPVSGVDFS